MYDITEYTVNSKKINKPLTVALLADLHAKPFSGILEIVRRRKADIITVAGDFIDGRESDIQWCSRFFAAAAAIAPTFAVLGNHEYYYKDIDRLVYECKKAGADILCNSSRHFARINIGGLSSKYDLEWLAEYDRSENFKLLLCHQPEYFPKYIKDTGVDLVFSGHAHGGQIRIFGQGLYSPDQLFFPKLTGGMHDNRLIISRGLSNNVIIPRIFNKPEIVFVTLK